MKWRNQAGFSLVETLVAVVILGVGMMILAGGSLYATRDLVRSRQATVAAGMAQSRLDELRVFATATTPMCGSPLFSSSVSPVEENGVRMSWIVPSTGANRTVRVIVTYDLGRGRTRTDTLAGRVAC